MLGGKLGKESHFKYQKITESDKNNYLVTLMEDIFSHQLSKILMQKYFLSFRDHFI